MEPTKGFRLRKEIKKELERLYFIYGITGIAAS
jgi:hypothetical protein